MLPMRTVGETKIMVGPGSIDALFPFAEEKPACFCIGFHAQFFGYGKGRRFGQHPDGVSGERINVLRSIAGDLGNCTS